MKKSTEELLMIGGGIALILFLKGRSASAATTTGTKYDPTGGVYAGANALPTPGGGSSSPSGDPTGGVYAGAIDPTGGVYANGTITGSDPTGGVYGSSAPSGSSWAGGDPMQSDTQLSGYSYVQRRR